MSSLNFMPFYADLFERDNFTLPQSVTTDFERILTQRLYGPFPKITKIIFVVRSIAGLQDFEVQLPN